MGGSPVTFTAPGASAGDQSNLQHAYLELREPPSDGGTATPSNETLGTIDFQFNPKELSLTKNAKWKREAQRNAERSGPPEFTGSDPCKLSVEMFLDATAAMDDSVVKAVEKLFSCVVPTEKSLSNDKGSPPWVIFHWGGLTSFPAFASEVAAKYTLFTPSGTPVRAVCTVKLEEISGSTPGQNPTSGSLEARSTHVVVAGDSLPSIAYRAYGDPNRWRLIAEANGIDDPARLRPGARLLVPAGDGR